MSNNNASITAEERRERLGLGVLFGAIYFIQGIGEPTEGLIAQPVRSLLSSWGHSASDIATFAALLSVPWVLKPLYGLVTDFVPIGGSRRRSYLLILSVVTSLALLYLYLNPPGPGSYGWLLVLLLVPTVGVAFSDVVADALMVEKGQPRGITGQLQSVQWGALYAATILTGFLGGYLSQHGHQEVGFLVCAVAVACTGLLAVFFVHEDYAPPADGGMHAAWGALRRTLGTRVLWGAAGFLFLWSFNPFSSAVLYLHMTRTLQLSEQFYGNSVSVLAVAAVIACIAYGFYCRRVPFKWLIHVAIVSGVASTLAYWALAGQASAIAISAAAGFTYMTGTLIQLDLAARVVAPQTAGTAFALLMAVSNLGFVASAGLGGSLYDEWIARWGEIAAFDLLVAAGGLCTSACWLIVPWIRWQPNDRHAAA